jgi:hypothetical protein
MAEGPVDFLGSMPREDASTGRTTPNRPTPSAFRYERATNRYCCPGGKFLVYRETRHQKPGLVAHRYEARIADCQQCERQPQCCPGNQKRGRGLLRLEESASVAAFRQKMATETAQEQYRRRGRIVEFCHAWIKSKPGLRRFHVRGMTKAGTELLRACLTYNMQQWIRLHKLRAAPAGS